MPRSNKPRGRLIPQERGLLKAAKTPAGKIAAIQFVLAKFGINNGGDFPRVVR
jgi:hypothetical protein